MMTTRKQPVVQMRLSRFVILCLALVAVGAVAHDLLAGQRMWGYWRAEAEAQVAEAEWDAGLAAQKAIRSVNREQIAQMKATALPRTATALATEEAANIRMMQAHW